MAYHRRPIVGMDDIHHLLGATLRDAGQDRQGRIVGLDYNHDQPLIDILWEGQKKVERIEITLDQLAALMHKFVDERRTATVRAVDSRHSSTDAASRSSKASTDTDNIPTQRRRA